MDSLNTDTATRRRAQFTMKPSDNRHWLWFVVCAVNLVIYVVWSESVRAFLHESSRLISKL